MDRSLPGVLDSSMLGVNAAAMKNFFFRLINLYFLLLSLPLPGFTASPEPCMGLQRDTLPIPWEQMDFTGPESKPAAVAASQGKTSIWIYPAAAVLGGGLAWWLKERSKAPADEPSPNCSFKPAFEILKARCGLSDGQITVEISPPGSYVYAWSNGDTGQVLTRVPAAHYVLTVTDVNLACSKAFDVELEERPPQYIEDLSVQPADCPQGGDISFVVSGGEGPFQVVVTGPLGTNTFSDVSANSLFDLASFVSVLSGNYTIEVADQAAGLSCVDSLKVEVGQVPPYTLQILQLLPPSSPTASDGSIHLKVEDVLAHPPPYQILVNEVWVSSSNSPDFFLYDLSVGTYHIQVLDGLECPSETLSVELASPFGLSVGAGEGLMVFPWIGRYEQGNREYPYSDSLAVQTVQSSSFVTGVFTHSLGSTRRGRLGLELTGARGRALYGSSLGGSRVVHADFYGLQSNLTVGHVFHLPKGRVLVWPDYRRVNASKFFRLAVELSGGLYGDLLYGVPVYESFGIGSGVYVRGGLLLRCVSDLSIGSRSVLRLPLSVYLFRSTPPALRFRPSLIWHF